MPPTRRDWPFLLCLILLGGLYVVLIVALLVADLAYIRTEHLLSALRQREVRYSIWLSLICCSVTAILAVWVAVPLGYLLSRYTFPGKRLLVLVIDVPIVLPPLVIGISLLLLFQTAPGRALNSVFPVTFAVPAIILAQFSVATSFAVRTMRVTFNDISPRQEQVALTLGCSRSQAFWLVLLPQARQGIVESATVAWARSLGEFGPVLVFAGATRMRTEVLPTTIFLELSTGNLEVAVAVSLLMVATAFLVLLLMRLAAR